MAEESHELRRFAAEAVELCERPRRTAIDLRGDGSDPRFVRAVHDATGVSLPLESGTVATGLLARILWLGPDEWLVASDAQAGDGLLASLRAALRGAACALTDVSDARIVYAVSGSNAREVLAKGCPLDLHERAFPAGRCAQTLLAKVPVIVHRGGAEPTFDVHVARSFADYAWAWLTTAAADYAEPRATG